MQFRSQREVNRSMIIKKFICDISSVGRAIPCQGIGHRFEPDMSLQSSMARWQNGYAADCKSVYLGSTPGRASTIKLIFQLHSICPSGGIGRHKGFKIPRLIGVPVQVWPRVPFLSCYSFSLLDIAILLTTFLHSCFSLKIQYLVFYGLH